jgi:hypothetical protein
LKKQSKFLVTLKKQKQMLMVSTNREHGRRKEVLGLSEQMQHKELLPDESTATFVSNALIILVKGGT